jgi:hypothetical protein
MKRLLIYLFLFLPLLSHSQELTEVVVPGSIKQFRYWDYTHIKVQDIVYLFDDALNVNLDRNNIFFLGEDLKIDIPMVTVSEAQKYINGHRTIINQDVFKAMGLEYRLTLNNILIQDWKVAKDVQECTKDSLKVAWEFVMNPALFVMKSNNIPMLFDNSSVVATKTREEELEPKSVKVPIERKIIFTRKMKLNDSVKIDLRFIDNPKIMGSIKATRIPIKPFLSLSLADEEADAFLLGDDEASPYYKKIRDSSLSPKYLLSKWDSLPSTVTINYPSSVQRIVLRFTTFGATGGDSTLMTSFGMEKDSLKEIGNTKDRVYLRNLKSGNTYLVSAYYKHQPENEVLYKIVIAPRWYQTNSFKWILGVSICLLLLAFTYLFYSYKIQRQKQEQARIDLELKSIRSQLNPHFIFNALSSIQGLINNNEIDKANIYLSEFGSLMRDTLSGNNTNNNTLSAEIKFLTATCS